MSDHAAAEMQENPHYYVPESGWYPVFVALGAATMMVGIGRFLNALGNGEEPSAMVGITGFLILAVTLFFWFAKVVDENLAGLYNSMVNRSFVWGMGWFIFSEVMFFFAFFLALFYVRMFAINWIGGEGSKSVVGDYLYPDFASGYSAADDHWPIIAPEGGAHGAEHGDPNMHGGARIGNPTDQFKASVMSMAPPSFSNPGAWLTYLPFWNTVILLSSSVTVHIAHNALLKGKRPAFIAWLALTVILGFTFVTLQAVEYHEAYTLYGLTLNSGIYGSTFFMLTGFHGFHVCLGAFILLVQLMRAIRGHFSAHDCFGFEAGSWYWHFVDVVWIFLFTFVYVL